MGHGGKKFSTMNSARRARDRVWGSLLGEQDADARNELLQAGVDAVVMHASAKAGGHVDPGSIPTRGDQAQKAADVCKDELTDRANGMRDLKAAAAAAGVDVVTYATWFEAFRDAESCIGAVATDSIRPAADDV